MELQRGICVLCTRNTRVVIPSQARDITRIISSVLSEKLDLDEFEKIHSSLKVCPVCLQNLLTVKVLKEKCNGQLSVSSSDCCLCNDDNHLIILKDWQQFDDVLENVLGLKKPKRCLICLNCVKCLDLLDTIRDNLVKKYPQLSLKPESGRSKSSAIKKKDNDRNRKSVKMPTYTKEYREKSKSEIRDSVSCVSKLETALKHLKPVKDSIFNYDGLDDMKLLKQIAFVKLYVTDLLNSSLLKNDVPLKHKTTSSESSAPSHHFFKIKIKPKSKRTLSLVRTSSKIQNEKKLIIKLVRMNFDHLNSNQFYTPTKAIRKLMSDDETSSGKKRKSVTFAEEKNIEIEYGNYKPKKALDENDITPLKPSLKRSPINYEHDKNSKGDTDDSEEEEEISSYVEDIKKNNDNIFDRLKEEVKQTELKESKTLKSPIVDSSDEEVEGSKAEVEERVEGNDTPEKCFTSENNSEEFKNEEDHSVNRENKCDNHIEGRQSDFEEEEEIVELAVLDSDQENKIEGDTANVETEQSHSDILEANVEGKQNPKKRCNDESEEKTEPDLKRKKLSDDDDNDVELGDFVTVDTTDNPKESDTEKSGLTKDDKDEKNQQNGKEDH